MMKKAFVLFLLIAGIVLVVLAVNTYQESSASLDVLGLKLSAHDQSGQQRAILYFIFGLVSLAGSYLVWKKR
ncbi:MAG: hypothetical protein H6560_11345 [Lewinellaceae bacterium]|nr:hypothetical protein [Lewinellaceae bacterium]